MPSVVIDYLKYICGALTICASGLFAIYLSINYRNKDKQQ